MPKEEASLSVFFPDIRNGYFYGVTTDINNKDHEKTIRTVFVSVYFVMRCSKPSSGSMFFEC